MTITFGWFTLTMFALAALNRVSAKNNLISIFSRILFGFVGTLGATASVFDFETASQLVIFLTTVLHQQVCLHKNSIKAFRVGPVRLRNYFLGPLETTQFTLTVERKLVET